MNDYFRKNFGVDKDDGEVALLDLPESDILEHHRDTGLTIRGHRVFARIPDRYRYGHELKLADVPIYERLPIPGGVSVLDRPTCELYSHSGWNHVLVVNEEVPKDDQEYLAIREWQRVADEKWLADNAKFIAAESRRTEAIARATALESLPPGLLNQLSGPTECFECGAIFSEPGHVEPGQMGCDRCG